MAQPDFLTTPFDPVLLSIPYRAQTRWHVLTGAACSGKTTLLNALAENGYHVIPESARFYFEREMAHGHTLEEIRRDGAALQRGIASLQLEYEREFPEDRTAFLDRAFPDSLTFFRAYGLDPNEILPECFHRRYLRIFILDRLPFHRSRTLGPEDDATSDFLDEWLERDYAALGYDVVRVPVLPPAERLPFILKRLPPS
jgi:predicted ATPase